MQSTLDREPHRPHTRAFIRRKSSVAPEQADSLY